ncbi:hypothetical protein [Domibacillus enclensis]|uniref:Uncharacterized protein n=1 Tax=Domibacillus enclensis TaxID=1017273 RepID=A0A1N6W344_9BACI|nr:hypothetical protein [Domibacillus enclensis]OXS77833.1 hypothetical protein B1B05_09510 [Domibacillus enclensis]SIQ84448.1 hypothetical protein SAMN05443094_10454 [Domibacillus enclensis]
MGNMQELLAAKEQLWVEEIDLPLLGKCKVNNQFDRDTLGFKAISATVANPVHQMDQEEEFVIINDRDGSETIPISIHYERQEVSGQYTKRWQNGLTETVDFVFPIDTSSIDIVVTEDAHHIMFSCRKEP